MLSLGGVDYLKPSHAKLLERVWFAAFPDSTYPGHLADDWRFIGFHGTPFLTPTQTLISVSISLLSLLCASLRQPSLYDLPLSLTP
jgi:hypothetical protein